MRRLSSLLPAAGFILAAATALPAQSGRFDLVIAATTDVHGRLRGWDDYANAADPALMRIEHKSRIPTLIAKATGPGQYRFDIRLQGEAETVFFDI